VGKIPSINGPFIPPILSLVPQPPQAPESSVANYLSGFTPSRLFRAMIPKCPPRVGRRDSLEAGNFGTFMRQAVFFCWFCHFSHPPPPFFSFSQWSITRTVPFVLLFPFSSPLADNFGGLFLALSLFQFLISFFSLSEKDGV